MKSYTTRITLVMLLLLILAVSVCEATPRRGLTLLVVPSRYSVMQVALDVVHRYGAALVSYQGDATSENPDLFAWNGMEWVKISLQDYAGCTFMQAAPSRTVLVGGDDLLPPMLVEYAEGWSVDVLSIPSVGTADLVNSFANIFSFRKRDWAWFARRYNLDLEDLNSERRQESWYDRQQYDDKWAHRWPWLRRKSQDQTMRDVEPVDPVEEQPAFITAPLAGLEIAPEDYESETVEPAAEAEDIGEAEVVSEDTLLPPPFEKADATVASENVSVVVEEGLPEPAPVTGDMMSPVVEEGMNYDAVESYPVK